MLSISVFIDPESTIYYVSTYFADEFDMIFDRITVPICDSTPMVEPLAVDRMYRSFLISLAQYDTWVDLIILGMVDFLVIYGMNWLSPYYVDCDFTNAWCSEG